MPRDGNASRGESSSAATVDAMLESGDLGDDALPDEVDAALETALTGDADGASETASPTSPGADGDRNARLRALVQRARKRKQSEAAVREEERLRPSFATVGRHRVRVAYQTFGSPSDRPLLLLHGAGGCIACFPTELINALLAERLFVIAMDQRDSGDSDACPGTVDAGVSLPAAVLTPQLVRPTYSLDDLADDALGLLDEIGVEKSFLFGHSMGGMVAQLVLLKAPERILGLATFGSSAGPGIGPFGPTKE